MSAGVRMLTFACLFIALLAVGTESSKKISTDKYLKRYGYFGNVKDGKIKSDVKNRALENFQMMANVPVTKKMDSKTYEMMQMSRCGVADVLPKYGQKKVSRFQTIGKWNKPLLTWNISQFTQHLPQSSQLLTFQRAFSYWSDVVPLTFNRAESGTPDIDIKFVPSEHGDGMSFDGPGNIVAHAFFPGSGPHAGCAHFDDTERWSLDEDGVDLLHMATHQLGHVLGLGHSTTPSAVMQPFDKGFDANFELHTDDIQAIQKLYGARYPTAKPSRDSAWKTTPSPSPSRKSSLKSPESTMNAPGKVPGKTPLKTNGKKHKKVLGKTPKESHVKTHKEASGKTLNEAPTKTPEEAPVKTPKEAPVKSHKEAPVKSPKEAPVKSHKEAPVKSPKEAPIKAAVKASAKLTAEAPKAKKLIKESNEDQGKPQPKSPKESVKNQKKSLKKSSKKNICKLKFDAIIHGLDNKTWAFRKNSMYDLNGTNITQVKIKSVLMKSPINVGAALYHPVTKELFLFKGKKVWKYVNKKFVKGYPKTIKDSNFEEPNAALLWHNGHIFLFKDDKFWAWDENTSGIMEGYPRSIAIYWPGLPEDVDAALRLGSTIYFFKDRKYYKLDNVNRAVQKEYPKGTAGAWLRC